MEVNSTANSGTLFDTVLSVMGTSAAQALFEQMKCSRRDLRASMRAVSFQSVSVLGKCLVGLCPVVCSRGFQAPLNG